MANRILIVDDDDEIRKITGIYLSNEGFEILKAENGPEALEVIKNHVVDLVILDIMMPGMNDIEVCLKIREKDEIPISLRAGKGRRAL
jgi:DNA-binding response OmpR family regulator